MFLPSPRRQISGYKGKIGDCLDHQEHSFRYVDIFLGIVSLLSLLSLEYGAANQEIKKIVFFFIVSCAVVLLNWAWFIYLKHCLREREASEEVRLSLTDFWCFQVITKILYSNYFL